MLPKRLRLRGKGGFEAVFRSRKAIFGSEIGLFFRPTVLTEARVGFAFKQKVFPRSATRNFLKRKGSAIMRELTPLLPKATDIVILFNKPFLGSVKYAQLKKELQSLVERLNKEKK
ncbi:MAG: ribonuclease P protein component [Candidatus Moraniibacteriota bacterium]|nr:MAG: ribonuclease P protein component [Candidatus Moranbacteria bacterium]